MDKLNWESAFPETSEEFHKRVETTLKIISTEEGKMKKRMSKKNKVLLIAAAVMIFGSITANAAGLFKWNHQVAEKFSASERQQNDLILKGVTEQKKASVTDNGLTISLVQTLQDKNYIYVALEVTAPEDIMLGDTNLFETFHVSLAGGYTSVSGGFIAQTEGEKLTNKRMFEYWIHKAPATDTNATDITLYFKNLQADAKKLDMYTILEGEWKLSWILNFKDSTKCYDLNHTYNLSGYDVMVDKVEVSPLSMTIYYKGDDIKKMEKAEGINLDHLDTLKPIMFGGFKYKDGTSIQLFQGPGGEGFDKDTGEYISTTAFDKVINVEDVEGILLGQNSTELKLIR